jgi:CheY-like chemotaxis protein
MKLANNQEVHIPCVATDKEYAGWMFVVRSRPLKHPHTKERDVPLLENRFKLGRSSSRLIAIAAAATAGLTLLGWILGTSSTNHGIALAARGAAPFLILVSLGSVPPDLKLPKIDGLEVLRRIRADERTRRMPVTILASTVTSAKPVDFYQFAEAVRQLEVSP